MKQAVLALICLFIGAGISAAAIRLSESAVTLVVKNRSSEMITSLVVRFEEGQVVLANLDPGSSTRVMMTIQGESSYSLLAELESGKVFEGGGAYIEPGYSVLEVVGENGFTHEQTNIY